MEIFEGGRRILSVLEEEELLLPCVQGGISLQRSSGLEELEKLSWSKL